MTKTSPTQRSLAKLRKDGWTCGVVERRLPKMFVTQDLLGGIDLIAIRPKRNPNHPLVMTLPATRNHDPAMKLSDQQLFDMGYRAGAHDYKSILGIQTTSDANLAARRTKLLAEPRMRTWLEAGGRLVLHGWAKKGARGARKLWVCREIELTLADFATSVAEPSVSTSP